MEFRIADTFTASLARLTGDEQKAVKTTAFDLQVDPGGKGMSFHKLDRAKDRYVDHHDKAYQWAERRKLEVHPTTGAAQLVEIRERVEEILISKYVEDGVRTKDKKPNLFGKYSEQKLLAYGVPQEWIADVKAADEDSLLELANHLPGEAAEALLELATGGTPVLPEVVGKGTDPFSHPDAQRRFRVMSDMDELARALEFPWDRWTVFLHPAQRQLVERDYNGAARVSGSAGTGKTVVALHRTEYLARQDEDARVLLSTFSDTLASTLRSNLYRLIWNTPKLGERIDVNAMDAVGIRLYTAEYGRPTFARRDEISALLKTAALNIADLKTNIAFLLSEWDDVVDTWQINDWESYRDAKRLGRKTRLPEAQRALYWEVFSNVKEQLKQAKKITVSEMFAKLVDVMLERTHPVFDYIVIDEAQDISVQQLRFLAAIGGNRENALFFAGDLGQRIFQTPFSWKSLGVDVRGRSRTLYINYRTSHQIRSQADRLLGPEVSDVDGNTESRKGTISVFNGPEPIVRSFSNKETESQAVGLWLKQCGSNGVLPEEIGVFVRSEHELSRAQAAVTAAGLEWHVLGKEMATEEGFVNITTMHLAKGMEFRVVAVMACDDEIVPLQSRIDMAADEIELTEIYNTERQLLYVACTRARDQLHVSAVKPGSEFLQDLLQK